MSEINRQIGNRSNEFARVCKYAVSAAGTLLCLFMLVACSDTGTTPTSIGNIGNVAGSWIGTAYATGCDDVCSCPAQASFEQHGSTVAGTLNATSNGSRNSKCTFAQVEFRGSVQKNILTGTITGKPFIQDSPTTGEILGSDLRMVLKSPEGRTIIDLNLHR